MKTHTTNYTNTFIEVADDCPAALGEIPPIKGNVKTIANIEYDMIKNHPYQYTSDEVLFHVFAERNDLTKKRDARSQKRFFFQRTALFPRFSFN